MMLKKSLRVLTISLFMLHAASVIACEEATGFTLDALSVSHKELAAQRISQAQAARQKAVTVVERLNFCSVGQPGYSLRASLFGVSRIAELAVTARMVRQLEHEKKAAEKALQVCQQWHDGEGDDLEARSNCDRASQALQDLTRNLK